MPLARNAMYIDEAQILATPIWDKSDNWLKSLQHIAREGSLYVISYCMALKMWRVIMPGPMFLNLESINNKILKHDYLIPNYYPIAKESSSSLP
jgi:hypothetical protein